MRRALPFLLLLAGAVALFLGGLGRLPLSGRDEALYAEAGREMLASGDWITPRVNGGPFYEKPPLYYWLAAVSYRVTGVSPFAARLPAALMAILAVALTALIGAQAWGRQAGLLAGIALATSLLVAVVGRMGIMDVPLMCLTMLALLAYARWRLRGGIGAALAFGAVVGAAVLLKALAGAIPLLVVLVHSLVCRKPRSRPWVLPLVLAVGTSGATALPWFAVMSARSGESYRSTLFFHEHLKRMLEPMQGHGGPLFYYVVLIAVAFFPWVVFLPASAANARLREGETARLWHSLALAWFLAILIPFSLISTKLPGYVVPLFPAMALLAGAEMDQRLRRPGRAPWIAAIAGALALAAAVSLLPVAARRLAAGAGAMEAVGLLIPPVTVWVGAYVVTMLGAALALLRRQAAGIAAMGIGQTLVLASVLVGILPIMSPYLEGGREARLVAMAERELPGRRIVLYDTRAEAVAFALRRSVPVFGEGEDEKLLAELRTGPTALIAPAEDRPLWRKLGAREVGRVGNRVLLDVPRVTSEKKSGPMGGHGGADETSGVWDTAPGMVDMSRAKDSGGRGVPPAAPDPSSRRPRRSAWCALAWPGCSEHALS